jgi:hypothetical protein
MGAPGCGMVNIESSRTSWAWVASAGAESSSVRMYSWLMCGSQALSGSCSFSTVARRPARCPLVVLRPRQRISAAGGAHAGEAADAPEGPEPLPARPPIRLAVPLVGGVLVLRDRGDGSPAHELVHQFREPVARRISQSKLEVVRSY